LVFLIGWAGGQSRPSLARRNVSQDYRTCSNDDIIANMHARHDSGTSAYQHPFADPNTAAE
jgi:hypothetical protein